MDEPARLAALRRYRILDTDPEPAFDDLTLLASHICGTPIALISLVDENRQWFKSRIGLDETETARDISFCNHAIQRPRELMVVPNALEDARPGLVRWRVVSDDSHMTHFLFWREVRVEWQAVSAETTRVTWTLRYDRGLDPAWYFGPMERYAVRLAAGYLIDAVATP